MNCSESRRLQRLFSRLWQELRGGQAASNGSGLGAVDGSSWWSAGRAVPASGGGHQPGSGGGGGEDDAYLYILLIMIFYGCLAGGLILAYTRSRKLESKSDPYHLYIERDWTAPAAAGGRGWAAAAAAEANLDEGAAAAHAERRSSGDSELL